MQTRRLTTVPDPRRSHHEKTKHLMITEHGYTVITRITVEKVVSEALELPPSVRAFVAEKLIKSLDVQKAPRLSAKWKTELRRRCAEVDRGAVSLHADDAVFKKAYASLA